MDGCLAKEGVRFDDLALGRDPRRFRLSNSSDVQSACGHSRVTVPHVQNAGLTLLALARARLLEKRKAVVSPGPSFALHVVQDLVEHFGSSASTGCFFVLLELSRALIVAVT
jgi:hypothetical protein